MNLPPLYIDDLDDTLAQTGVLQGDRSRLCELTLAPGAQEFLDARSNTILLSAGERAWQEQKIEFLGLRPFFKEVVIVPTVADKEVALAQLVERYQSCHQRIIVIGDRCDLEIKIGNRLQCYTIRLVLPRGKYATYIPQSAQEHPDFSATDFFEVRAHLQSRGFL